MAWSRRAAVMCLQCPLLLKPLATTSLDRELVHLTATAAGHPADPVPDLHVLEDPNYLLEAVD